jgi:hypothetical protein
MQPLGGLIIGSVSKWIGTPDTMLAEGIFALLIALLHFRYLCKQRLRSQKAITETEASLQVV